MNTFTHEYGNSFLRLGEQTLSSGLKPEFSFAYDTLRYTSVTNGTNVYTFEDVEYALSSEEISEIETYLETVEENTTESANFRARDFLRQTDWYVVRQMETGEAIPVNVLADRAEARENIVDGE